MSSRSWFNRALLPWYRAAHRPLPWRQTRDPYRIWLSEVILQQTRVDQGLPYYERFVRRYPTVKRLAAASEQEVLKLWQGLGYYSRGRNLLKAALQVVEKHGGRFPADHAGLMALPGVGDYTAAAIASIAFNEAVPVVDGNVYRVLSRVFGVNTPIDGTAGRREFRALAASLVDPAHPGDHNQAVMELGATVCTPLKPACADCPVARWCVARKEDRIAQLPVKAERAAVRVRHFNYLWIERKDGILLRKRGSGDIWQGLHEFPLVETPAAATATRLKEYIRGGSVQRLAGPLHHVLSHQRINAVLWKVTWNGNTVPEDWRPVKRAAIKQLPVHRLMEKLMLLVE